MDYDSFEFQKYTTKSELDKSLHELEGYLKGVSIDHIVNRSEIEGIRLWLKKHAQFRSRHPYSEIIPVIEEALSDQEISKEETDDILWLCDHFKSGNIFYDVLTSDIQRLHGVMAGIM